MWVLLIIIVIIIVIYYQYKNGSSSESKPPSSAEISASMVAAGQTYIAPDAQADISSEATYIEPPSDDYDTGFTLEIGADVENLTPDHMVSMNFKDLTKAGKSVNLESRMMKENLITFGGVNYDPNNPTPYGGLNNADWITYITKTSVDPSTFDSHQNYVREQQQLKGTSPEGLMIADVRNESVLEDYVPPFAGMRRPVVSDSHEGAGARQTISLDPGVYISPTSRNIVF